MRGPRLRVEPPIAINIGGLAHQLVAIERTADGTSLLCRNRLKWHSIPLTSDLLGDLGWTLTTALLDAVLPAR